MRPIFVLAALLSLRLAAAEPADLSVHLFPPDQVMQQRQALELNEAQTQAIQTESAAVIPKLHEQQAALQRETGGLATTLSTQQVDETRALAQLDRVLDNERAIKRLQLTLMIRVKNLLSPAQQELMRKLRTTARP